MLEIQMRVNLRRTDVGMTEQLLDSTQIAARFEQVRRKGMAKHVRMQLYADALPARPQRHAQLNCAWRQTAAPRPKKQRRFARFELRALQQLRALHEPFAQRLDRIPSYRDDPGLAAL